MVVAPMHPRQEKNEPGVFRVPSLPNPKAPDYPIILPIPTPKLVSELKTKPNLIFFHHPFLLGDIANSLASYYKVPSVFMYHSAYEVMATHFISKVIPAGIVSRAITWSVRKTIDHASHVVALTQTSKSRLKKQGVKIPISVIPTVHNPMTHPQLSTRQLQLKLGLDTSIPVILCVSRLSPDKEVSVLIDSLGKLNQLPFQLMIVGDGPEKDKLIKQVNSQGLANKVKFYGIIPFDKMSLYYSASDLFAFPSQAEVQAGVILEAMSAGLPIIAFNTPGPNDFIDHGKNGLLANNQKEFTNYLEKLLTNKLLREKIGNNAKQKSNLFSLDQTIDQLEELFAGLVKKNNTDNIPL